MKTIIISDIKGKTESVIPYGLRIARALEVEADVLHIIDTRTVQGHYSSFSDSKSISPGSPLSFEETINKEKNFADIELDKLMSKEASRLNYPLKIKTLVEVGDTEDIIVDKMDGTDPVFFIINAVPDGFVFRDLDEITDTFKDVGATFILVPPKIKFSDYKKVLLITDFEPETLSALKNIKFLPEKFNPYIEAITVVTGDQSDDLETREETWKNEADKILGQPIQKIETLKGDDVVHTLLNYIKNSPWDLVLLTPHKRGILRSLFRNNKMNFFFEHVGTPVLIYYDSGE